MGAFGFWFNFNKQIKPIKAKTSNSVKLITVESHCEGIVKIRTDGTYYVVYNKDSFNISLESYNCKGKKNVYTRFLDKYNHRVRIIRDKSSRNKCDKRFYIPFAPGLIAKGRLVKGITGNLLFHIVSCYNIDDAQMTKEAFNDWKTFIESNNNG